VIRLEKIVKSILQGIIGGILYALSGYLKHKGRENVNFNPEKFIKTIILGAIIGFISGYSGLSFSEAEGILIQTGMVAVIEQLAKALYYYLKEHIEEYIEI